MQSHDNVRCELEASSARITLTQLKNKKNLVEPKLQQKAAQNAGRTAVKKKAQVTSLMKMNKPVQTACLNLPANKAYSVSVKCYLCSVSSQQEDCVPTDHSPHSLKIGNRPFSGLIYDKNSATAF